MEELTKTEERIMQIIWDLGRCLVRDIIQKMPDEPKPPYNTISSVVRLLESKGFLSYKAYGKTYEYFPIISKEEYGQRTFKKVFADYFGNSMESLLSFMVKEENLTLEEIEKLKSLINNR
ncbi:BlaI/MecI/CopY family transcriptional regulator [Emticicia sp. SJ17W-69]|uniref:BlaI/MecI/CopY family transcriptional regulator n=1 Tax=Emticicia sp. SJ17W-69 TaxID=3421657 RepID=UPI003EB8A553